MAEVLADPKRTQLSSSDEVMTNWELNTSAEQDTQITLFTSSSENYS